MGNSLGQYSGNELCASQVQKQKQKLTGAVLQGIKLLTLPADNLNNYLSDIILGNPLVELNELRDEPEEKPIYERSEFAASPEYDPDELFNLKGMQFELDSLSGSLELQLYMCGLSDIEYAIGREIIGNIDGRGYFVGNLQSICLYYGAKEELGQRVISLIQGFSPLGIAARDIYECLCLQVDPEVKFPDLTRQIIREDLKCVGEGGTSDCARKYKVPEEHILEVFEYIRSLEPYPGNCDIRGENICYTKPDLLIQKCGSDEFSVLVSGEGDIPLKFNAEYLSMLGNGDLTAQERDYLDSKLEEARAITRGLTIRQQTIKEFGMELLRLQSDFFRIGEDGLRPLTMQRMAAEMGVNVSTVSRVVTGKYMDTPWGMYPFKFFFSGACGKCGEDSVSVQQVKKRIRELATDKRKLLNDTQICAELSKAGYRISRRTVTKYRSEMGFEKQRKRGDSICKA